VAKRTKRNSRRTKKPTNGSLKSEWARALKKAKEGLTERQKADNEFFVANTKRALSRLKSLYTQKRNPLWVWQAYRIARHRGIEVPEWVLEYFDLVACNLEYLRLWTQPKQGGISPAILRALGFVADGVAPPPQWQERQLDRPGRFNPFAEALRADEVYCLVEGSFKTSKAEAAQRLGVSQRTIERHSSTLRALHPATPGIWRIDYPTDESRDKK
jgi:hypothetical protein